MCQKSVFQFDDGLELVPVKLISGNFRNFKVVLQTKNFRWNLEKISFFFVLETPMYKMTCIKCVHFNPMMAYGWFQLYLFLEISASLKGNHANQKCQMKIGKIGLVTLMPTSKKKTAPFFREHILYMTILPTAHYYCSSIHSSIPPISILFITVHKFAAQY